MPGATVSLKALRVALRARNPMVLIRALAWPEPSPPPILTPQLALWVSDAVSLPPRPWRVERETPIDCRTLHGVVPAHVCVARQVASDAQRTTDRERGQVSDYPSCVTTKCAQGRSIRAALEEAITWRGAGPNHRFERSRSDAEAQRRARQRADAAGRLDGVPTMDEPPEGEEQG